MRSMADIMWFNDAVTAEADAIPLVIESRTEQLEGDELLQKAGIQAPEPEADEPEAQQLSKQEKKELVQNIIVKNKLQTIKQILIETS